jgi:hypothetical protein
MVTLISTFSEVPCPSKKAGGLGAAAEPEMGNAAASGLNVEPFWAARIEWPRQALNDRREVL